MRQAFAAVALTLIASPVAAENRWTRDGDACNQRPNTVDIMQCLEGRAKVWDSRLNQAYGALTTMLTQTKGDKQLADLKKAQRLWVQYRDANCAYYGDAEGTIREVAGAQCMRDMTQTRAIELQSEGPQ